MNLSEFRPHPKQAVVLKSNHRFNFCVTGIRWGKTTLGAVWLLQEIYKHYKAGQNKDYLILAPTVKILNQAALPTFKDLMPADWGEWKEQKMEFQLSWGKRIFVRSTDDPKAMEGLTAGALWYDEAGMGKEEAWDNAVGRVSLDRGRIIVTSTPYFQPWFKRSVFDHRGWHDATATGFEERNNDIAFWTGKSTDNPLFPQEEYEAEKKRLPESIFKMKYDGEFTKLSGLVYAGFDRSTMIVPRSRSRPGGKGLQESTLGKDATVVLFLAQKPAEQKLVDGALITKPSEFYCYREFYKRGCLLHEVAKILEDETVDYTLGDPSAAQEMEELRRFYGVRRVISADNKIGIGIQRIQMLFNEKRLFFFDGRTPNTVEEIEAYSFKENQDKPEGGHDHCMDALKYAFSREMEGMYSHVRKARPAGYRLRRQSSREIDPFTGYSFLGA